ncbi:MAG: hypothetical protein ABW223_00960 [Rariglobus sp.]
MIRRLALRRSGFISALLLASGLAIWAHEAARAAYPHLVYITGWGLLALMLVLTGYNVRKKLAFLPLLSSRAWFQIHVYLGLFTGLAFVLHLQWRFPTGWFEGVLAAMFVGVTLSGIVGWWLSRLLPKRLTTAGGEVPYDRIPVVRRDLRAQAEALVLGAIPTAKATTLADFYTARLAVFFSRPAHFRAHAVGSRRPLAALLDAFTEVNRFLSPAEKETSAQLAELVRQKDALDFHRAVQLLLKTWLFVHIPLTYGLLVFSFVHVVLVYAFAGGAR